MEEPEPALAVREREDRDGLAQTSPVANAPAACRFSTSDRCVRDFVAIVMTLATITVTLLVHEGGEEGIDLVAGQVIDAGE